jgi:hypothetical protein
MNCFPAIVLIGVVVSAPDSDEEPLRPQSLLDPRAMEVQLADQSLLKLLLADERIKIVTPHGTLHIPTDEIRRIEFAQRLPEPIAKQVGGLIEKLTSPES